MNKDVIVTVKRGKNARHNTLYASCHEVGETGNGLLINATLDYVITACNKRGYKILNAQQVLNWLLDDGQLTLKKH